MIYDLIVVGAGPAGSTAAYEAASGGASVLLLDRARFPRDKPCGGGVNVRAAKLLPFSIEPVVERTVSSLAMLYNLRPAFTRTSAEPLCYMTQRARLDAFLVEQATRVGSTLHDGEAVRSVDASDGQGGVSTVRTRLGAYRGRIVVGADGANGVVARASGLAGSRRLAVALEANYAWDASRDGDWTQTIGLDLGIIPGGYGWLFPKGDHLNIGVGGWQHFGPTLRRRLDRLAASFGRRPHSATSVRGHFLPVRFANAPLARAGVMLAGDAAGLVDPLSGEGIYAAICSGRLAAVHALRGLAGATAACNGYSEDVNASLGPDLLASQRFQDVFHLMPAVYLRLLRRSDRLWNALCGLVRGDQTYLGLRRRLGPIAALVDLLSLLAHSGPVARRAGLTA